MTIRDHLRALFDAPSRRRQADYSQDIPAAAIQGVLLLYRDLINRDGISIGYDSSYGDGRWMQDTIKELGHLHHSFAKAYGQDDLSVIESVFLKEAQLSGSLTTSFLDFLEVSLRSWLAPNWNNDFVDGINEVLQQHGSPYLLSRYVRRERLEKDEYGRESRYIEYESYPKAYLQQETVIQREAIEPALGVLDGDSAYSEPAQNFRTALNRHRLGDYDGCVTACAAAVEGAIKVVARKNGWRRVKGTGLDTLAQSFLSKSSLSDTLATSFRPLSNSRNRESDAHGHASKVKLSKNATRHYIALAASLIVLVQSEEK